MKKLIRKTMQLVKNPCTDIIEISELSDVNEYIQQEAFAASEEPRSFWASAFPNSRYTHRTIDRFDG
ncbi:hypothetical protein OB13_02600 [Pontibacter sp. HJ8]